MNIVNPNFRKTVLRGKNKTLFKTEKRGVFSLYFEEENSKIAAINAKISKNFFELLSDYDIKHHFISENGIREHSIVALDMLPLIFSVYSYATPSISERFFLSEGKKLRSALIEVQIKNPNNKSTISKEHAISFGLIDEKNWNYLTSTAKRVMDIFYAYFKALGLNLISINIEFGKRYKQDGESFEFYIADDFSFSNLNFSCDYMLDATEEMLFFELAKKLNLIKGEV